MSKNKEVVKEKWLFMNVREHPIGLIVDNIKPEDLQWMTYSPYEDALNRMNQDTIETLILEFVEMMWSIEPDYRKIESSEFF